MGPEEGFIQALVEGDETAAFVFADWLEEHDDSRGTLLRLQRASAAWEPDYPKRLQVERRQRQLIEANQQRWLGPLRSYCRDWQFADGVVHITMDARRFSGRRFGTIARAALRHAWVQTIRLEHLDGLNFTGLASATWLDAVAGLDLGRHGLTDDLAVRLLANPHLTNLAWLDVSGNRLTDAFLDALRQAPFLPRLRWLDLRHNQFKGRSLAKFLVALRPGQLQLDLFGNPLGRSVAVPALPGRLVNSLGMEFVEVPAGSFLMGSPDSEDERHDREGPRHAVTLTRPFHLGLYPVTQGQYQRVMGTNPSRSQAEDGPHDHHPVDSVTHARAVEFCRRLSRRKEEKAAGRVYRLPTEAEWEHAARGGTSLTPFCFGDSLSSYRANFDGSRPYGQAPRGPNLARSVPVGLYRQWNAFGLCDLFGNIWEWCADRFGEDYYQNSPAVDPTGTERGSGRVLRGGSWYFYGMVNRAAFRGHGSPSYTQEFVGFRVALDVKSR